MIARLTGLLVEKGEDTAVLDVHGVGYLVHLSAASLLALPARGEQVSLRTITHVREDALDLFGFLTGEEEDVFRALVEVKGVGPRAAQNILSGIEPRDLAQAVAQGDVARLTKVPGVGKKTAERLVVEMKDKVGAGALPGLPVGAVRGAVPADPVAEASVALQALGYKPAEVGKLVQAAAAPGDSAEAIIRKALKSALRSG